MPISRLKLSSEKGDRTKWPRLSSSTYRTTFEKTANGFLRKIAGELLSSQYPRRNPRDCHCQSLPSTARNERRFQPKFRFKRSGLFNFLRELSISSGCGWIDDPRATYDFNQRITWNPFESHASTGRRFAGREISPVDLVQRVVLRFMGIEPCLAG